MELQICASALPEIKVTLKEFQTVVTDSLTKMGDQISKMDRAIAARDSAVKTEHDIEKGNVPFIERYQTIIASFGSAFLMGAVFFFLAFYLHVFGH
jgi:hypothetical protein